jgi:hypothetical protein
MNKKIFFGFAAVLAITLLIAVNVSLSNKNTVLDISLAQIEALAQNEGTSVGTCYLQGTGGVYESKIPCDSRTDNNTIYPCLSSALHYYTTYSDRCTK